MQVSPRPILSAAARRTLRVLVVEDETRLRDLLADVIPEMGFPAVAVRSAEEALLCLKESEFDIVVLDLQLPQISGMEFFERLRTTSGARRSPEVIIITAYGDLATARRAIQLEVVDFLSKPFHLSELELALDRARVRCNSSDAKVADAQELPAEPTSSNLAEVERATILAALKRHGGNRTATAIELGISRRTLHYRLSEYRRRGENQVDDHG